MNIVCVCPLPSLVEELLDILFVHSFQFLIKIANELFPEFVSNSKSSSNYKLQERDRCGAHAKV